MSGKGCDTTTKALKLAVAKEFGNRDLSKLVMFAGYAAGSTLGGGSLLLLYMLTQFPASGGDVWSALHKVQPLAETCGPHCTKCLLHNQHALMTHVLIQGMPCSHIDFLYP